MEAAVRVHRVHDDDLRARDELPLGDQAAGDSLACRLRAVDAADDEDAVCRGRIAQDDRADRAPVDAVPDRERGQEKGKESHLHAVRSQVASGSVHSGP